MRQCTASPAGKAGKGKGVNLAVGKAAADVQLDGKDDFLQELVELKERVYEVQDAPGKVRRVCFAKVRRMAERTGAMTLSPEAAAVLAEIQLCTG